MRKIAPGPPNSSHQFSEQLPMNGLDRRLTPRAEWLADIHFEPNNGGIVLNLSEGGLCFHSIDPLQFESTIRFSVSVHHQRMQAAGELAWIDQTKRTGGLRFTDLSAETRQQIRDWLNQPATQLSSDDASPRPVLPLRVFPTGSAIQAEKKAVARTSAPLAVSPPEQRRLGRWVGFSGGLAIGVVVSTFVAAALSTHSYRRQFGESIIHFGERVAAIPQTRAQTVLPSAQQVPPTSTAPQVSAIAPTASPAPALPRLPRPESVLPRPAVVTMEPQQENVQPKRPTIAALGPAGGSRPNPPLTKAATEVSSPLSPTISLPLIAVGSNSYIVPTSLGPAPPLTPKNESDVHTVTSETNAVEAPPEMYFEVGKFKDQAPANEVMDNVAKLGFRTTVAPKSRFWGNSYYVLVGPYVNDREAKTARKNLTARGLKPRAFERGSRSFRFSYAVNLNGARIPVGNYSIRWESYSTLVIVQFVQNNDVVATVEGKWARRDVRYYQAAYAFTRIGDGPRNLVEIRFAGMSQALVFERAS
jgi:PilZ domain/SPOR domain